MGTALWIGSGVVAGLLARIVPLRRGKVVIEIAVAVIASIASGLLASALDFGGWSEPDWRAAVFAFFVAFAAIAGLRSVFRPA